MRKAVIACIINWIFWIPGGSARIAPADSLRAVWKDAGYSDSIRFEAAYSLMMGQFRSDLDSARSIGLEILDFATSTGHRHWEAVAHRLVGNTYAIQGNFPDALDEFLISHGIMTELGDRKGMSTTFNNIGTIHYEQGNYTEALRYLLQGLKISEELEDTVGLGRVTNNLGNVYLRQENFDKALEYYTYSMKIKEAQGNPRTLPFAYNNIGLVYNDLGKFEEAIVWLNKCDSLSRELGDLYSQSRAYNNLGQSYAELKEYDKSLDYLNRSIEIKNRIGDKEGLSAASLDMGQLLNIMRKYREAIPYCRQSLEIAMESKALLVEHEACICLSEAYEQIGQDKKALEYFKRGIVVQDSLFNREKVADITRQEMEYVFEKQQLADSLAFVQQQAEQTLKHELALNRQRTKLYIFGFGGLGLLLIGAVYYRGRQKSKELEQERKVVTKLKQVDQLKDQFLANTSHELRTPLNGIIGLSESLMDGAAGALPDKAIENLNMISSSGKRLAHLVNDILDFSKLRNEDLQLHTRPVDVKSAVDVVLKLTEPLIAGRDIELVNNISPDIPLVEADENRLQQILHNLVGNAVKFTVSGSVTVDAKPARTILEISVTDTGIGIPGEKFESIFQSFEQAEGSISREFGGTGLGLSVSRQLVRLHGGDIKVASEVGVGSTFTFTLPVSSALREMSPSLDRNPQTDQPLGKLIETGSGVLQEDNGAESARSNDIAKHLSILVVDDEVVNRRVLQNHLNVAGYEVTEASTGGEALDLIASGQQFDLVLLDIMMPGTSGYEVCERIRKEHPASELPIVLLTAKNRVSDLVTGFSLGANDYLTKPISKNELLSRIRTHINLNTIHKASSKFVPVEFLSSVGRETITEVMLGDHIQKEVSVVFTDIRDYTTLSESMTPRQNFKFVNAYVGRMGPHIQRNDGFVNQYLGDGIMALFPKDPRGALQAAIDMHRELQAYNKRRVEEGYVPIRVGMGVHTGPLVMGIIGDHKRNDTAIIADTVNTASRMEGITKYYGAGIIVSEDFISAMEREGGRREDFHFRYLGRVRLKGKDKAVGIYECYDGDAAESIQKKDACLAEFNAALQLFSDKNFREAADRFKAIAAQHPGDMTVRFFLEKAEAFEASGVPSDWGGIDTFG